MGRVKAAVPVLDYLDFRDYLRDYYTWRKKTERRFSYRSFAKLAGVSSSGLYLEVCEGKRNLTRSLMVGFSQAMGHSEKEAEYFENMVLFNQAKTVDERNRYFSRMSRFFRSDAHLLEADRLEYYSIWYYAAVRELFATGDFGDNYPNIAKSLRPSLRPHEAKKAVKILRKLKLIKKDSRGYYRQQEAVLTTGPKVRSLHVANFQRTTMALAREAIDRFPPDLRDISTLTLSVTAKTYKALKPEIVALRQRLLAMASRESNPEMVCQVNFQLFPMSVVPKSINLRRREAKAEDSE